MNKQNKLLKKLFVIKSMIESVQRTADNPFASQKSKRTVKYAPLSAIQGVVMEHLKEQFLLMDITFESHPTLENWFRAVLVFTDVEVYDDKSETEFASVTYHFDIPMDTTQSNPVQGFGSTTTYGQRYILAVYFNIPIEDVDPDAKPVPAPGESKTDELPWLNENTREFKNVEEKLKTGVIDMKVVREHYKVNKKNGIYLESLTLKK